MDDSINSYDCQRRRFAYSTGKRRSRLHGVRERRKLLSEEAQGKAPTTNDLSACFGFQESRLVALVARRYAWYVGLFCFFEIRTSTVTLVHAIVVSRIDYCNAVLACAPKATIDKLQRVLNAAARVVTGTKKFERGLSRLLHTELDVPERVMYKLSVMMYSCLHGQPPQYTARVRLPSSLRRRVTASSPICWSATAERTAPEAEYICTAGFLCGWSVGVELVTGLPERPGSQQRHFLQPPKDVLFAVYYVQRIRGFTTMRYINLRFTHLLTYGVR